MPKTGPTDAQWLRRITKYAAKDIEFTKGQYPAKGTKWGKEKVAIDSCPLFKSGRGADLFGNKLSCS